MEPSPCHPSGGRSRLDDPDRDPCVGQTDLLPLDHATQPSLALLLAPAVLLGCGGDPGTGSNPPYTMSSLNEKCDGTGPTGAMILAATQPKYDTNLTTTATMMQSPLTITVAYMSGAIHCTPAMHPPPGSAAPEVPAMVDVNVAIGFHTGDGVFAEDFTADITGNSFSTEASFSHSMKQEELKGTFDPNLTGYTNVGVSFGGSFAGANTHGTVGKGGQRPGMVPESFPFVAMWDSTK